MQIHFIQFLQVQELKHPNHILLDLPVIQIDGECMIAHQQETLDGHTNLLSMPFPMNQIRFHPAPKPTRLGTRRDCLKVGVTKQAKEEKWVENGNLISLFGHIQVEKNLVRFHIQQDTLMIHGAEGLKYKEEHLQVATVGIINLHSGPFHQALLYNGRPNNFNMYYFYNE